VKKLLLVLLVPLFLFSNNGYKEFDWGISPADVKAIVPDLLQDWMKMAYFKAPTKAMLHTYSSEITSTVPNPFKYEDGSLMAYESKNRKLIFFFVDEKLIGVTTSFFGESIFSTLKSKYGVVTPALGTSSVGDYEVAAWFNSAKKTVVVWVKSGFGVYAIEEVTYFDMAWFTPLEQKAIDELRRSRINSNSRLD